jgi:thymidylate synthase
VSFINGILYSNHQGNCITCEEYTVIKTFNKDLAYGIQNLTLKINISTDIFLNNNQEYELLIYNNNESDIEIDNEYAWFKIIDVNSKMHENINVYNFEVELSNTYTVQNINVHNCYGWQWRYWGKEYDEKYSNTKNIVPSEYNGFDQIENIIHLLKNDPNSRRMVLNAWNVDQLEQMALPPCHLLSIFNVQTINNKKYLNCHLVCRSTDVGLGLPYNLFSYSVLVYILAMKCDLLPGTLYYTGTDVHIYSNHLQNIKKHFKRTIKTLPKLSLNENIKHKDISDITIDDFDIIGYYSDSFIKMEMAV